MAVATVSRTFTPLSWAELESVHDQLTFVLQAIGRAEVCLALPDSAETTSAQLYEQLQEASLAFQRVSASLARLSASNPE
jgi:hypothetical protein